MSSLLDLCVYMEAENITFCMTISFVLMYEKKRIFCNTGLSAF